MVFSSPIFLFVFFPITFGVYYLIDQRWRNGWLLICSLLFYAWSGIQFVIILVFSVGFNFLISKGLECKKRAYLVLGIIFNLGLLGIYKYLGFFAENIAYLFHRNIMDNLNITMPIGISFFTFQILAYDIDLYLDKVKRQPHFLKLLLYVSMFPQLIAGPIVRYRNVEDEINKRELSYDHIYYGLQRFVLGLGEKVLLADTLGGCLDIIFTADAVPGTIEVWLGMLAYSLQIYFDFTGYSDMAIGMGEMLGFHFNENFLNPYQAVSIRDFWKRWHISLSSWFRDYLYIPLGGSRNGKLKTYRNLLIVFTVTGLWHGASWNFVIWGLWHGFFLIVERFGADKIINKLPKLLQHIYTLLVVGVGWLMFRSENFIYNMNCIRNMFKFKSTNLEALITILDPKMCFCILLCISICCCGLKWKRKQRGILFDVSVVFVFWASILQISANQFSPFLYFRF